MELFLEILYCFGLSVLGGTSFALLSVWKKIKTDRKFDAIKFFGENKAFWVVNTLLALCLSLLLNLEPDAKSFIQNAGFVVETGRVGYVWIGIVLAGGTNSRLKKGMADGVNNA